MVIRPARAGDEERLVQLIVAFRASLAELRDRPAGADLPAARQELADYRKKGFPVYVADANGGQLVGYLVCRVDDDVVWAESLYVVPERRRQGVASSLYEQAERVAAELGGDTVYNWVDPDNAAIIEFLRARGYTVLNLIELRSARPDEQPQKRVRVGSYQFHR